MEIFVKEQTIFELQAGKCWIKTILNYSYFYIASK